MEVLHMYILFMLKSLQWDFLKNEYMALDKIRFLLSH